MLGNILIFGGDKRQSYLNTFLKNEGQDVSTFAVPDVKDSFENKITLLENLKKYYLIICPIPFTKDNENINISPATDTTPISISEFCDVLKEGQILFSYGIPWHMHLTLIARGITIFDLSESIPYKYVNSRLTAEGLVKYIMDDIPFSITNSKILISGYGCCGKPIAEILKLLGGKITVYNRNISNNSIADANGFDTINSLSGDSVINNYDIIINTVPSVIYKKDMFNNPRHPIYIFDVASAPGGFEFKEPIKDEIHYKLLPGIPGKIFPESAAKIIFKIIKEQLL